MKNKLASIDKMSYFFALAVTILLLKAGYCHAQGENSKVNASTENTHSFYYFNIPSSINGSDIDPSPVSNIAVNITDNKISGKLGFPKLFRETAPNEEIKHTGFLKFNLKGINGTTLFKAGKPSLEYGVSGGISRKLTHNKWSYTDEAMNNATSSERVTWLGLTANLEQANFNIFDAKAAFNDILNKQMITSTSLFFSYNQYFHSDIQRFKPANGIWSLGLGFARANNYYGLKKRTLEEGSIVYNADSSKYRTIAETTLGAVGPLVISQGLSAYGEYYFTLVRSMKNGSVYFGNRLTYLAIGSNNYLINGNTGFFFNIKDRVTGTDTTTHQTTPAKDIINFSVTGQFNQLNKLNEHNYYKDNFTIQLQAAVPLRFN
ncbi:MAG: hypothetical protein V4543_03585 [Bacteroidota bacterium]